MREFARTQPPQLAQMRAAAHRLPQIVRDRPHVRPARAARQHFRFVARNVAQRQLVNLHRHRRQLPGRFLARHLVSALTLNFLGRDRRRSLQTFAEKRRQLLLKHRAVEHDVHRRRSRHARTIVAIRRKTEPDARLVNLFVAGVELRQARGPPDHQRQHAGRDGIERAQMPHFARSGDAPHAAHHVVGGPASRLVNDDDPVHPSPPEP